ncbi:MAG: TlyA family RNA methyltransferase [Clostridia bacterium]|nr:TlyA family RNA methyltransferase [Clostridia bacterium]
MRADVYLVQYGYAPSRSRAARMITEGSVRVDGVLLKKVSDPVDESLSHAVELSDSIPYVGRGGLKLEKALDAFLVTCDGKIALDVGASTGGFTDCMLQRGAAHIYAVDTGSGQLAPSLCADARVTNIENCNARYLNARDLGVDFPQAGVMLAVMDVSFISQTLILPSLSLLLREGADLITLVKPQFEVGRSQIGKGGIVRTDAARRDAILRVLDCVSALGLSPRALISSPILGGDGNSEYLLHLKKTAQGEDAVSATVLLSSVGL